MDWKSWHDEYDVPGTWQALRLQAVQRQIRDALDNSPDGPLQAISVCAGQGRDLLEVLAVHLRRDDVRARLVELDARNTACAERSARIADLNQIEIVTADASITDSYQGMVPADLVLVCGVFGNILDRDIERTVDACRQLCKTGGVVIWTRVRNPPDRVPLICKWFEERNFSRLSVSDPNKPFGLGAHRFDGQPHRLMHKHRMFTFIGYDVLGNHASNPLERD